MNFKTNAILLALLISNTICPAQLREQNAPRAKSDKLISPMQLQGDQHRAMLLESIFADLQEPTQEEMNLEQENKTLLDILRATIDLDEEIQKNKQQNDGQQSPYSLSLLTAYNLARVKLETTATKITSKVRSWGYCVPGIKCSQWWHEGFFKETPNKFEMDVRPSTEHVGYLNITIHAQGVSDKIDKNKRAAHAKFAGLLRQLAEKQNTQNNQDAQHANKEQLVRGKVENLKAPIYGSSATIRLHCNSQLIAYLIKEKARQKAEIIQAQEDELLQ